MFSFSFIFSTSKHFSLSSLLLSLFLSLAFIENNEAQQTHFSIAIQSTFSKSKVRKFKPASFTNVCIGVAQGFNLDLKPCFIASDWAIHLSKHRKRVAELHVTGKRRERVIGASRRIWNLNGPLSNWNRLLELPKTLVDRRQNVKAHRQVQTRLAVISIEAPLEHVLFDLIVFTLYLKHHYWVWILFIYLF